VVDLIAKVKFELAGQVFSEFSGKMAILTGLAMEAQNLQPGSRPKLWARRQQGSDAANRNPVEKSNRYARRSG